MNGADMKPVNLNETEWRLIRSLREIPDSPLRDLLEQVLQRLTEFVREPRCFEMQADGVPCDRSEADCEQCMRMKEILTRLSNQVS